MTAKINAVKAKEIMDTACKIYILDVRPRAEFDEGHIKNAISIPLEQLLSCAARLMPDKRLPVLIYCRTGARSATAAQLLNSEGYGTVLDFGSLNAWPFDIE